MGSTTRDEQLEGAVAEFRRYLGDEIAPLMAVDSVERLLRRAPELTARAILGWIEDQRREPGGPDPTAGFVFHAVKKLHLFSEFDLVERRALDSYLAAVARIVVQACPEADRSALKLRLSRLGQAETTLSAPVQLLHRERGDENEESRIAEAEAEAEAEVEAETPTAAADAAASPRITALMDRLRAEPVATEPETAAADDGANAGDDGAERISVRKDLIAQLLSTAALESRSPQEFETFMAELRRQGIVAELGEVFKTLGRTVPGWAVAAENAGTDCAPTSRSIEAMRRIVALSGDRNQGTERFGELVYAAIEQLNEGHLAQSVAMFDLALTLQDGGSVDPELARTMRGRAQSSISLRALRRFSTNPDKFGLLRRVLDFFPAFTPSGLIGRLDGEPKRENRKLMLSLLEVHGPPCRPIALDRLGDAVRGDGPVDDLGYYTRNLVWLLRRIPARNDERLDEEFDLLRRLIEPGQPAILVKETLGAIGQSPHPDAERTLIEALAGYETTVADPAATPYSAEDGHDLLDRTCAALARLGTVDALRTVAHHAFRAEPGLGDTLARLEHLGVHDLSNDPEQLANLVDAVRSHLPSKMRGLVMRRPPTELLHLVRALTGTNSPVVGDALAEVAARLPGTDVAEAAGAALARAEASSTAAPAEQAEDLTGDLELFGLPNLMQTLAESRLSGQLTIRDRHDHVRSTMTFVDGQIRDCATGPLRGETAVFQLFVRPEPGTFAFRKGAATGPAAEGGDAETMFVVLEALRRHDEFQLARAMVPDGSIMIVAGKRPGRPADEADPAFLRKVWSLASAGAPPETCESAVRSDAFRVRRLYALWLEQGALRPRPATA